MKKDAFDDLNSPFNYNLELMAARETLQEKIGAYVSKNGDKSYRELAKQFGVSLAALCAIAKRYSRKRKRGRFPGRKRLVASRKKLQSVAESMTFNVRYRIGKKELHTAVTVKASPLLLRKVASDDIEADSIELMRNAVARYFKTDDVSVAGEMKVERHAEYTYDEIWNLSGALLVGNKRQSEMKTDLATLTNCVERGMASDAGDIAYDSLMRWVKERRRNKNERLRAQGLIGQYEKLRAPKGN